MIKTFKPILDLQKYSQKITDLLVFELYYDIFRPLFEVMGISVKPAVEVRNAGDTRWNAAGSALARAIQSGRITWRDGWFYGKFSAAISRELRALGATFSTAKKAYKMADLPVDIKAAIAAANATIKQKADILVKKIDEIAQKSLEVKVGEYVGNIMEDLHKQFTRTVKAADYEVPMEMSPEVAQRIKDEYAKGINTYINDWKQEQIDRLREKVQENVAQGFRADKMARTIEAEYDVSKNKAKFLARQETAVLVSKYRQARYQESGIEEYIWSTSHDERVRPDHADLMGKKFSWSDPPIVDKSTGRRGNPGEDFGCRCIAIPVVKI
jgi:SPP1 gp7 family putative phage head morphogenesis protein